MGQALPRGALGSGAVLNAFEIYFELGFATLHGCEGWDLFDTHSCAKDGYTNLESIRNSVTVIWIDKVESVD